MQLRTLNDAVEVHREVELGLDDTSRLSFGVPWLDAAVGGVNPGSLVVVGGRTGTGKSFFTLNLLASAREPALYISCEDSLPEVGRRVLSVPAKRRAQVALFHPHNPRLSVVLTACRAAVEAHGARWIAVDYLQLLRYDGDVTAWSQTDQIHNVLIDLKACARELGFVLVLSVQIRRPMERNEACAPSLYELKDSSSIENSAEVIVLLHENDHGLVEARVAKSKFSRRAGRQTYERSETGWLVECDDRVYFDEEEGDE